MGIVAMNGNEELPGDHFWDAEEAEQEYYEVGRRIAEAEEKAKEADIHFLCEFTLAYYFRKAFCRAQYKWNYEDKDLYWGDSSFQSHISELKFYDRLIQEEGQKWQKEHKEKLEEYLHTPLNPYWLSPDGSVHYSWGDGSVEEIDSNLTLCEATTETVKTYTHYSYSDKNGYFNQKRIDYSYLKRVEWYTITGEAAVSGLEWALRNAGYLPPRIKSDTPFDAEELVRATWVKAELVEAALTQAHTRREELIQEVRSFLAPYYRGAKWKFVPDLAPDLEAVHKHFGRFEERWKSAPTLSYPSLAHLTPPEIGHRWNYPYWIRCGQWATYRFPGVEDWLLRLEGRFRDRIVAGLKAYHQAKDALDQLRRQREAIRMLHYKPLVYKMFWPILLPEEP